MSQDTLRHFWLRDEVKPGERRTPILPVHAKKLVDAGFRVTVESSAHRCAKDEDYTKAGCTLVPTGTWKTAPQDAIILGLKELDMGEDTDPLVHKHVYFAHCYKNQTGWKELLARFIKGKGDLLDLEFLTHDNGVRVAAFGRCAGFIGMAVGIMDWVFQQTLSDKKLMLPTLSYYDDFDHLVKSMREQLKPFETRMPKVLVLGALGRCGRGAVSMAEGAGLEPVKWDLEETRKGGPFEELLNYDIVVNCIYLAKPIPPFINKTLIERPDRRLSVVVDVSCDFTNPENPLPIYSQGTTFFEPTVRVMTEPTVLDVVSIDHLPSLVPLESSQEFADALIDHLMEIEKTNVWSRANKLFVEKTEFVKQELKL